MNLVGQWILKEYQLRKEKEVVKITLLPGTNNYLTLFAHNTGAIPPNTAILSIRDGEEEKMIVLVSDLNYCGAINFVYP